MEFTRLYLGTSDDEIHPDPTEIADVRWLLPEDIETEMAAMPELFSPAFRLVFRQYLQVKDRKSAR